MTREEAITALGDRNNLLWGMSEEEKKYYSEALEMAISALSENKCFDGMTNGEAMNHVLRKTFPRIIFIRAVNECNKTKSIVYAEEWENTPYKAERKEE